MAVQPNVLFVGKDADRMHSRTLLLSNAGYAVQEAYLLDKAATLVELDSIALILICHTVPADERQFLVSLPRNKKSRIRVVCIRSFAHESLPFNVIAVDNDPEALLECLKSLINLQHGANTSAL